MAIGFPAYRATLTSLTCRVDYANAGSRSIACLARVPLSFTHKVVGVVVAMRHTLLPVTCLGES